MKSVRLALRSGHRGATVAALFLAIGVGGCTAHGLGVERTAVPAPLHGLYDRALFGDKEAQYHLGLWLALGAFGPPDCKAARQLLARAASDEGGTLWVYSPPVGNGTAGRVIPIDNGPRQTGLTRARDALDHPAFCPQEGVSLSDIGAKEP